MKAFKYLIFSIFFLSSFSHAATRYSVTISGQSFSGSTATEACLAALPRYRQIRIDEGYKDANFSSIQGSNCLYTVQRPNGTWTNFTIQYTLQQIACPSATKKDLKVPVNSQSYVCVQGCQYRLRACVDVDSEPGMTCTAISTGQDCGTTPPPKTPEPDEPPPPEEATPDPANPTPEPENTAQSESTSESTSQSQTTSTQEGDTIINNTITNTTTNTTTTTTISLDRLENIMKNLTSVISSKLDAILGKMNQDGGNDGGNGDGEGTDLTETNEKLDENNSLLSDLKDWLTGGEDGSNGSGGDNTFGNDAVPEKAITPQDLKTNIFGGSASCPADRTLSFQLFTGKTFSKSFSFSMWCDKLAIFGTLILIASYLYAAYIITSKS
ncbi:hypothetical protein BJD20_05235 [Acinetobacter proteolyticus]|uniref:virulence factor TspB C-terminal domain-related protein n=1 Tax=Acinetobacter proteolyticus TaxID=1776741 RepID=UPI00086338D2|nr:virulence factor TspB C-terminal domain-related protein [Acinetobacter proteolyticus]OEY93561.1 hypothetical protein BJD20_05235 [Acinetobacter proteolyticus]